MNRLLSIFFCITLFVTAKGQSNYAEAMQQGDDAFKKGQYKTAINKYFAAEAFDPTKKDLVKEKVNRVFDAIEALRKKAEKDKARAEKAEIDANEQKKISDKALIEVQKQKAIADTALIESQKQTNLAILAKKEAEKQKEIAQQALKRNIEFQEKAVGKKYKGGIIFYSDSTREHGLIAAEKDLDSTYTWEKAKKACDNYSVVVDGITYDDWFLPSKDTLVLLYVNKSAVGSFSSGTYWSSSGIYYKFAAWNQSPSYSTQYNYGKYGRARVRAIRAF